MIPKTCFFPAGLLLAVMLAVGAATAEPPAKARPVIGTAAEHWAFQPVTCPAVPASRQPPAAVRNPIDAFIAARQEARGLTAAPEAPRRVLIRRLTLDLTGLPPTAGDVAAFLTDPSPDAYEKLVERLLASPHYGERWGRHWLDLARYADSEGYESDHLRPNAWRYRDYVVDSFNRDKPYDRFLREQVAGDELLPYADENLIATGFLASARLSSNEEDKARQRNDVLVDVVNATASTLLGLTLNCAQCHDHKFDPFTAADYYRFQGFFVKGQPANLLLKDPDLWAGYEAAKPPEYEPARKLQQTLLDKARASLVEEARKALTPAMQAALAVPSEKRTPAEEKLAREADLKFQFTPNRIEKAIGDEDRKLYEELKKKVEALEKKMPDKPQTFGFYSPATSPTPVETLPMKGFYPLPYEPKELARARPYLLLGGDVQRRGPEVDVGWPVLFGAVPGGATDRTPRLALADWLAGRQNPLTARIWVNRLWHYHFGRGLVATTSDFGTKGTPPTHPELLDWLASELVRSGWSTKHIHRLIVGSSTYRQASRPDPENARLDPDNTLWWRWSPRRLEAEAVRDCLLAVSGEVDRKLGGAPVPPDNAARRGLYLLQRRNSLPRFLVRFDVPPATESCPRRHVTTTPLHALLLLNDPFAVDRAKALARRVETLAGADRERQATVGFELVLSRPPDDRERQLVRQFFADRAGEEMLLMHYCHVLLNLNEFVYME
jgi:hypothetical protein